MTTETPRTPAAAEADVSLDPQDWEAFRALAHRMVDDSLDQLTTLRDRPPWTPPPAEVAAALSGEPLPRTPQGAEQVYAEFLQHVLPTRRAIVIRAAGAG
jgi:hypothetical protein